MLSRKPQILFTFLLCFLFFLGNTSLEGQDLLKPLNDFKKAVLVVRLDMQSNKIEAYEQVIKDNNLAPKDLIKTKEALEQTQQERTLYKQNVIKAFQENYAFSKVAFVENQHFKSFISGDLKHVLANEETLNHMASNKNYFFLIKGKSDANLIITDNNFKEFEIQFLARVGLGIKKIFNFFVGKEDHHIDNQILLASKINRQFEAFEAQLLGHQ